MNRLAFTASLLPPISLCTSPFFTAKTENAVTVARVSRRMTMSSNESFGSKLKLALCQMNVTVSKDDNIKNAEKHLREAAEKECNIAVLPECWNCPYDTKSFPEYADILPDQSNEPVTAVESRSLQMLLNISKETGMLIIGGSIPERSEGKMYNTSLTVNPDGILLAKHRKVHLFDVNVPGGIQFRESDALSAGNSITTFTYNQVSFGVGICYDVRFPELSMISARAGAHILVFPGAFNMTTGPAHWELLLRSRALDNQVFVAACSPARSEDGGYTAWGHSSVVDPWGTVIASTDEKAENVYSELDLNQVEKVRDAIPTISQRRSDIYELQHLK